MCCSISDSLAEKVLKNQTTPVVNGKQADLTRPSNRVDVIVERELAILRCVIIINECNV